MYNIVYRKLRIFQEIGLGTGNLGIFMPRDYALMEKKAKVHTYEAKNLGHCDTNTAGVASSGLLVSYSDS